MHLSELLHRIRYRVWGPRIHEAANCRSCRRIVAPFQGIRRAGVVYCCDEHVTVRELLIAEVWAW